MYPIHTNDLARLHHADLARIGNAPEARLRRLLRDQPPERSPLPPSPRLAVGRLVTRLRAVAHVGAGA
jgi:hypothetical protein